MLMKLHVSSLDGGSWSLIAISGWRLTVSTSETYTYTTIQDPAPLFCMPILTNIGMRTISLWQLFFGLFVNTHCLPDWNIDTQPGEIAASESLLGNIIDNPPVALGTLNGMNDGVNALSSEILNPQGSRDCASDTKRLPGKKKARRDNTCPADHLQFNNREKGRQFLPAAPSGQQGGGGGNGPR